MAGRTRFEEVPRPQQTAPAVEVPRPDVPAGAPLSPQALLALQRTAGNQAATAVLARQDGENDAGPKKSGWGLGSWLYGWVTWMTGSASATQTPTPVATAAEPVAEETEEAEAETVTTPQPTTEVAQEAPTETTAPPPIEAPVVAAEARKTTEPLSKYERVDLQTASRKLSARVSAMTDAKLKARVGKVCEQIDSLLDADTITDDQVKKVQHEISGAFAAIEKARTAAKAAQGGTATATAAATATASLPVQVLFGTAIGGDKGGWGDYGDVVAQVVSEMRAGRVTLGSDFKPQLALSVKGHWQQGDPQNFIKVYLDAADVGGGTQMRGYFRYKIFSDRLVIKFVAIRKEHGGKDTTVLGDHTELVSDTGT
jgi:hypothetical protein